MSEHDVSDSASQVTEPETMPKRLIICCDGTWQSATNGRQSVPSNVTRLARCLERIGVDEDGKQWKQVVWYDSGVGTTSGPVGRTLEGAVGAGLEGNVIEAYNFCVLNYSPGDQIMCFGFSRGAYTARSIAGLISDIGICKPNALQSFHELWALYKNNKKGGRFYGSEEHYNFVNGVLAPPDKQPWHMNADWKGMPPIYEREPHHDWDPYGGLRESRDIEVVGVWDTVGALGLPVILGYQPKLLFGPDKLGYHNVELSPNIKNAFQALALDEHRKAFSPTVWHLPRRDNTSPDDLKAQADARQKAYEEWSVAADDPARSKQERDRLRADYFTIQTNYHRNQDLAQPPSNLVQVWFPGVHINVGGGSSDTLLNKGDLEELSNLTFTWMLDQIDKFVTIDRAAYIRESTEQIDFIKELNAKAEIAKKLAAEESWGSWFRRSAQNVGQKIIHPFTPSPSTDTSPRAQSWGTGEIIDSYTIMYRANGWIRRTPGNYTVNNSGIEELGDTNEFIHPSIGYRMAVTRENPDEKQWYHPGGFSDDEFRREETSQGFQYIVKYSKRPITEYKLKEALPGHKPGEIPYERYAVIGERAEEYVNQLDKKYKYPKQEMGNLALRIEAPHEWIPRTWVFMD